MDCRCFPAKNEPGIGRELSTGKCCQTGRVMGEKSILLAVGDVQALIDITQALGAEWEITSAGSEVEALAQLEKRSFDALLADFNLGSPDASELLNRALEKRPE